MQPDLLQRRSAHWRRQLDPWWPPTTAAVLCRRKSPSVFVQQRQPADLRRRFGSPANPALCGRLAARLPSGY